MAETNRRERSARRSKKEGWRWHVFSTGAFIGAVWGVFYVVVPTLSSVFLTETVSILPIPFIDFTVPMKAVLPAAVVGVGVEEEAHRLR